jgi:hypothetical protein
MKRDLNDMVDMVERRLMIDEIRTGTLLHFIEQSERNGNPGRFRFDRDGLRFITDEDTVISDWKPRQVEAALRELEVSRKVKVTYRPHAIWTADFHIEAYSLKQVATRSESQPQEYKLSSQEITEHIKTDDQMCAKVVFDIFTEWDALAFGIRTLLSADYSGIPDRQIFGEMAQDLIGQTGLTPKQLAICRMPDEHGIPRLARYKQQVDELEEKLKRTWLLFKLHRLEQNGRGPIEFMEIDGGLWLLENDLPSDEWTTFETLEALELAGKLTLRRDGPRVTVTGIFLGEEEAATFQRI